ncbi:transglycosylase domain-containing protein [Stappia sp. ES.058]|uniref:transglycosylase domain-containing protein n=1 Tax=Stappia sp. ES.058 TaxID=1881061 RepID=UPI0008793427|nr:transglycosylase domain-containing protein [Stappia sp. ES.058]SDU46948.1 Transglycosylase [Stappia sp. ES.058]
MRRLVKIVVVALLAVIVAALSYGGKGYLDAVADADRLQNRAGALIADGRGGSDLGKDRLDDLLKVQDPAFRDHAGVDMSTPGAGLTTVTQSLAKRLGFETFRPGIGKIRQTGYALGLEARLSKDEIMALWLDTLEMGRGPNGWMTGFFDASETVYGAAPAAIGHTEFLKLVAVMIAPGKYDLRGTDAELEERTARIARLAEDKCAPLDHGDVWLEGCR